MRLVALALLLALPLSAYAQDQRTLRDAWNEGIAAYQAEDWEGFRDAMLEVELHRPSQFSIMQNVAISHALVGDGYAALSQLSRIATQGLYIPIEGNDEFVSLEGNGVFEILKSQIAANGTPLGASSLVLEIDARGVLAEGVAVDARSGDIYVSAVRTGAIYRVTSDGAINEFVTSETDHGLAGVLGIALDQERNMLWAVSAPADPYNGINWGAGVQSALFGFDLDTGAVRLRAPVPGRQDSFLGEVVIAPNGTIYVSDSLDPVIYRLDDASGELRPVVRDEALANLQGFAFAPDGRIYIADYALGLFIHDPLTRETSLLDVPFTMNTTGIDGLFFYDGNLIAIQNGLRPYRILRINLSARGDSIDSIGILARNLPEWDEPTLGQIVGHQLVYNAASGWPKFGANGQPLEDAELPPIRIMSIDLD